MTVKKKVIFGVLGFSLIPLFITTLICIRANISNLNTLYDDRLRSVAQSSAMALQEIVGMYKDDISVFSTCNSVRGYTDLMAETNGAVPESSAQTSALNTYLNSYMGTVDNAGKFNDILILNKDGKVVVSHRQNIVGLDLKEADYFQRIINSEIPDYIHVSQTHPSLTEPDLPEKNCIGVSKALYSSDGNFQGVLVGLLTATDLGRFAQNVVFGKTGLAFVIDSQNFILYHPEPRFLNSKTEAPKLQNMVMRYQSGRLAPEGKIVDAMDGAQRTYYYVILGEDELALVLRQNANESSGEVVSNIILLLIMFIATGLIAAYLGLRASKAFVTPILSIKEAFDNSRTQSKYIRCDVRSDDEIGEMAAGYNEMMRALESQYQLLQNEKNKVERIAMRDSLTDLDNRSAFESGLADLIKSNTSSFGVLFLDMDGFKQINDVLGHDFGDTLLYMMGRRIKNSAAKFDIYARLGGDEFALVKIGPREDVYAAAQILLDELRSPFRIEMHTLHVTTSMGSSMYPMDGDSVETLVKNADIAMYYSKGNGKNMFAFFDDEMQNRVNRQSQIMGVLRKGIEKEELYFVYQPEVDIKTNKVVAYEALMRINNPELGSVGPSEFIPIAESNNSLINNLGHWTLVQACRFAHKMVTEHGFEGVVAVNVSVMQLRRDNFVDEVIGVLEDEKLDGKHLQLELTESILIFDISNNAKKLARLREHGISVAMDDFGTHYSSFTYLITLPLDVLKIDRTFFADIETSDRMLYICETINNVAHRLGLKVVAEGVETERQHELMEKIGCDTLQGYHFCRPLEEAEVSSWHEAHKDN